MTDRDLYRQRLEGLSDDDLRDSCVVEKRLARWNKQALHWPLDLCWSECCRRGRQEIFVEALEVIRAELREALRAARRATEELTP